MTMPTAANTGGNEYQKCVNRRNERQRQRVSAAETIASEDPGKAALRYRRAPALRGEREEINPGRVDEYPDAIGYVEMIKLTSAYKLGQEIEEQCEPLKLVDEQLDKIRDLAAESAASDKIRKAQKALGECAEDLYGAKEELANKFNDLLDSMEGGLGFQLPHDELGGPVVGPDHYNPAWTAAGSGPLGDRLAWLGAQGAANYKRIDIIEPIAVPEYRGDIGFLTISGDLGNGTSIPADSYPQGWTQPLVVLLNQVSMITSLPYTSQQAEIPSSGANDAQIRDALSSVVEGVEYTVGDLGSGAGADSNLRLYQYPPYGKKDTNIHDIIQNGGSLATQFGVGPVNTTSDDQVLTPTAILGTLDTAAGLLRATGDEKAKKQADYLELLITSLSGPLENIKTTTACIRENLDEISREKTKVAKEAQELAEDADIDLDDEATARAIDDALGALLDEGLGADYFNKSKVIFKEQCWLLGFVDSITSYKKAFIDNASYQNENYVVQSAHKRLPYIQDDSYTAPEAKVGTGKNACLLVDGDPHGFLNNLVTPPSRQALMDARSEEISALQPKIRLFKVEYDEDGNDAYEYEIPFDAHFTGLKGSDRSVQSFLRPGVRGTGIGIKSFNFVFDGSNPFAIKKSISANLKIFANTMNELLKVRTINTTDGGQAKYRYTDLAMKTGTMKTGCVDINKENTQYAPLNFRLRAIVGWAKPKTNSITSPLTNGVYSALDDACVILNLTPTIHNFEIDDQGRVVFNINYLAYIDEFFDQSAFNIFAGAKMVTAQFGGEHLVGTSRHLRDMRIDTITSDCTREDREDRIKRDAQLIKTEGIQSLSFIISSLLLHNKVYYINLDYETVRNFNAAGPFSNYEKISREIFTPGSPGDSIIVSSVQQDEVVRARVNNAMKAYAQAKGNTSPGDAPGQENITAALVGADPNINTLGFFFLSDLIDIILENIDVELKELPEELNERLVGPQNEQYRKKLHITEEQVAEKTLEFLKIKKNFEKMRIILGPAEVFTRGEIKDGEQKPHNVKVNLGDMPISVKFFMEFLTDKMLANSKSTYTLTKFLNDLLNNLTREFLNNNNCFRFSIKQKTRINQTVVTSYQNDANSKKNIDTLTEQILKIKNTPQGALRRINRDSLRQPALNVSGPPSSPVVDGGVNNEYNYFVYFAARTQPSELMNGNKQQDSERGVDHYLLGRDRGLIKNIKLNKTETKGLAEVRFEQNGYQGLEQLRVVYDVEIESYANVATFPGTYIYVDPNGFAPKQEYDITKLGLGGYYMIIRSEHEFGAGYANSRITAKWVHSIEQEAECEDKQKVNAGGDETRVNRKCAYFRSTEDQTQSRTNP